MKTAASGHASPERGLSDATARVARALLEVGSATAVDLAGLLFLSPTAVRRHLDTLMDRGLVSASDEQQFGPTRRRGRGRPARFYAITAQGRDVFESTYDDVAVAALDYLAEHLGQGAVEDFARIRAAELSQRYSAAGAPADPADRVAVLVELLSADGYAASAEANPLGLQLCQHHCPIAHVAERYGQFCEAERAAFADLLGVHATRLATIAAGSGVCTTLIAEPRRTTTPDDTEASAERNPA